MHSAATERPSLRRRIAVWTGKPTTRKQVAFDVVFGIALPIVCLLLDPGILRPNNLGTPLLGPHAVAAYVFILPPMVALACWLLWQRAAVLLAGPLLAAAVVALTIGTVILPLSLAFSIAGIGLLGLVPFGTAIAFLRNGLRALHAARARRTRSALPVAAILGFCAVAIPVVVERHLDERANALVQAALRGEAKEEVVALSRLKPLASLVDSSAAIAAWHSSQSTEVQQRLERVWREATGQHLPIFD